MENLLKCGCTLYIDYREKELRGYANPKWDHQGRTSLIPQDGLLLLNLYPNLKRELYQQGDMGILEITLCGINYYARVGQVKFKSSKNLEYPYIDTIIQKEAPTFKELLLLLEDEAINRKRVRQVPRIKTLLDKGYTTYIEIRNNQLIGYANKEFVDEGNEKDKYLFKENEISLFYAFPRILEYLQQEDTILKTSRDNEYHCELGKVKKDDSENTQYFYKEVECYQRDFPSSLLEIEKMEELRNSPYKRENFIQKLNK